MAEPSVAPPLQPSQPSRKGKKAWRKNVDIGDVERSLDKARDEQIAGYVSQSFVSSGMTTS
jgi:nucleolar protein 53